MITVTLNPELSRQIENLTSTNDDAQLFVEKAIQTYLVQIQREKIRKETEAFQAQYKHLQKKYPGQYVAIHQGEVIDHDEDLRTLHLRVYDQLGPTPVLLKQVTNNPQRELLFRSPRLDKRET